jgi:hypothetical protein
MTKKWEWDEDYDTDDVVVCPHCETEIEVDELIDIEEVSDGDHITFQHEPCNKEVMIEIRKPVTICVYGADMDKGEDDG